MLHGFRWIALLVATAGFLLLTGSIVAVAPEVRDDGKFFSADALKKADEQIGALYRQHNRDVLIETFTTVPTADMEKVKAMDAEKRAAYFLQWAKERTKQRVVNGVYVLICKEPRHLLVGVHEIQPHKFAEGTGKAVESVFLKEFRESRFDEGLDLAIKLIEEKLTKK